MNVELIQKNNYSMGEKAYIQAKHLLHKVEDILNTDKVLDHVHTKKTDALANLICNICLVKVKTCKNKNHE